MLERTLAIIKPDAIKAGHSGKIIDRIEQENFNIIAMKKLRITRQQAEYFYEVHRERPFFGDLVRFMISGPIIVMALEKEDAIRQWRNLMGATDPSKAEKGTLRQIFGTSIDHNATHGSDSPETAAREISFFFPELA